MSKYIIDKNKLVELVREFAKKGDVYYPVKANSSREIIEIIDPYVTGYEIDSIELLEFILSDCKISPTRILYSSLVNDAPDYKHVLELGIRFFVVDSINQVEWLCSTSTEKSLSFIVRLDISDVLNCKSLITKWGCTIQDSANIAKLITSNNQLFFGVSFYIPQEIYSLNNALELIESIDNMYTDIPLIAIDIGGGMNIQDTDIIINAIHQKPRLSNVSIIIEPGRYLLNPCIDMLCVVKSIKQRPNAKLIFIDSGIYSGLIDCKIKNIRFELVPQNMDATNNITEKYIVCGITSDVTDTLGEYELPIDIQVGSKLLIHNTGAYCRELETNFYKKGISKNEIK